MPETPDFKATAERLLSLDQFDVLRPYQHYETLLDLLIALQRDSWNARGAADIAALDEEPSHDGAANVDSVRLALRTLDR